MKIVCCQFQPVHKDVLSSMRKVETLIADLRPGEVDVLVLPEMTFTGYVFENREDIEPLMEEEKGRTYVWCAAQATRLSCYVMAGYPLKKDSYYFNAMCLVSRSGDLLLTYAKHFLYETDKPWADEGPSFSSFELSDFATKIGVGICMDINPYEYIDPSLYEFATFQKKEHSKVIFLLANWLEGEEDDFSHRHTQNYWARRLSPLHGSGAWFVACNRVGLEKGSKFCGGSCVISLGDRLILRASLGNKEEGLLSYTIPGIVCT